MKKAYIALGICVLFCTSVALTDMNVSVSDEISDNYLYDRLQQQDNEPTFEPQSSHWWNGNWSHKKNITINHNQISDNLTNFPICINITDSDLVTNAQTDGDDIAFISADNSTQYHHEIELYNNTNGQLVAWVNVTSLSSSSDTIIWMYYGNASCSSQENIAGTWDSDYVFVHHMNGATYSNLDDSTSNSLDVTAEYGNPQYETDGLIGKCVEFDNDGDYFTIPDSDLLTPQDGLTFFAVIKRDANADHDTIFSKYDSAGSPYYQEYTFRTSSDGNGNCRLYSSSSNFLRATFDNTPLSSGTYHTYSFKYNDNQQPSGLSLFVDGSVRDSTNDEVGSFTTLQNTGEPLKIGADEYGSGPTAFFDGKIDEIRMSSIERSSDWTQTTYNNIFNATDGGFYTIGDEQIQLDNWLHNRSITFNSSQIPSNLTNFPVCINITDSHLKNNSQTDGDDILFTADNITKLNHEIELYNNTTGHLVAWVNITELSGTEDTTIYMYYGNATCSNQENVEDVWDSDYSLVYHFNDLDDGLTDSTSNNNDASEGANAPDADDYQIDSSIGYGVAPDGSGNSASEGWDLSTGVLSNSEWLDAHSIESYIKINHDSTTQYLASFHHDIYTKLSINSDREINFRTRETQSNYDVLTSSAVSDNAYHAISVNFDGGNDKNIVVDGNVEASSTPANSLYNPTNYQYSLTASHVDTYGINNGIFDEFRISKVKRSNDFLKTSQNTMKNATNGGFFTLDDEQTLGNQFTAWEYNRSITFNSSQIPSNLTNFPVCINITDTHLKNNAQADGDDILFTADNVTKLNHEIELYNSTSGQLVAWVNVTELSGSSDTTIWMYYGNATCNNQENIADVWDSDYLQVSHYNGDFLDSTNNNRDGTNHGSDDATGVFAGCREFIETNTDYISYSDIGSLNTFTISMWGKSDLYNFGDIFGYEKGIDMVTYNDGRVSFGVGDGSNWGNGASTSAGTVSDNTWIYYAGTSDGSTIKLFLDAVEKSSASNSYNFVTSYYVGGREGNNYWFDGLIDEVRVSNVDRSSDWITTTYNSMNNASDGGFFTLEPTGPTNTGPNIPTSPQCQNMTWSDTDHLTDHTPHFNWTFSDSDANDTQHGFQIQVTADEAPFGSYMWNYTENTSNESVIYNGSTLQDGAIYNWRVRVKDNDSVWSEYTSNQQFRMNTKPTAPELSSPANNSYGLPYTSDNITLDWNDASDPEDGGSLNYWWQYCRFDDFSDMSNEQNGDYGYSTGPTSVTIPQTQELYEQTEYYWRIRAWDGVENGSWSNVRAFTTDEIIELFNLTIPDNTTDVSINTNEWSINITHDDGDPFNWWINTTPDIGNASGFSDSDGIKTCQLSGVQYNTTYEVQVVVIGSSRNETYTFTTEAFYDDAASPPTNVQVNQTTNSSLNLTWTNNGNNRTIIIRNETGTGSYNTDLANATELYNGTGTQFEESDLTQGTTYYYTFWSYNETTGLYSATYAQANNTVKVLSLSISISPHTYDFASIAIPGTKQSTEYTFNITNDGLDASIAINVSNSQNWSFVNFSDRGLDAFCMNWSDDNWTSEQNIKTTGTNITSNLIFEMNALFDLRLLSPIAVSKSSQQEQWTITITATPR